MQIEARRISAGYGRKSVIHNIDFRLDRSEFVGLIGPNGAGKSTLLRVLSGVLPHSGELRYDGRAVKNLSAKERARHAAFVAQSEPAFFEFTAQDVVLMGRNPYLARMARESDEDYIETARAMAATDTLQLSKRPVTELSGGEYRRVLIARALAQTTPVLILDEPTAHLDLSHQRDILSLIRRRVDLERTACLAAVHDLNMAGAFCDRLILMRDGTILAEGSVSNVLRESELIRAFGEGLRIEQISAGLVVLPNPYKEPSAHTGMRIHIICGGGSGAEILSALQRRGFYVSAGVLNITDSDQLACEALGIEHVTEAPFSPISKDAAEKTKRLAERADVIVISDMPFGLGNLANLELAEAALTNGVKVVIVSPESIGKRDFTAGRAENSVDQLLSRGAIAVSGRSGLLSAIEQIQHEDTRYRRRIADSGVHRV